MTHARTPPAEWSGIVAFQLGFPPPLRGGNCFTKSFLFNPYPVIPPYYVRTPHSETRPAKPYTKEWWAPLPQGIASAKRSRSLTILVAHMLPGYKDATKLWTANRQRKRAKWKNTLKWQKLGIPGENRYIVCSMHSFWMMRKHFLYEFVQIHWKYEWFSLGVRMPQHCQLRFGNANMQNGKTHLS